MLGVPLPGAGTQSASLLSPLHPQKPTIYTIQSRFSAISTVSLPLLRSLPWLFLPSRIHSRLLDLALRTLSPLLPAILKANQVMPHTLCHVMSLCLSAHGVCSVQNGCSLPSLVRLLASPPVPRTGLGHLPDWCLSSRQAGGLPPSLCLRLICSQALATLAGTCLPSPTAASAFVSTAPGLEQALCERLGGWADGWICRWILNLEVATFPFAVSSPCLRDPCHKEENTIFHTL